MRHTPGPWTIDGGTICAGQKIVARMNIGCMVLAEYAANSLLLSAAPDLLEALELAKCFGSQGETHEGKSVSWFIEKAIAKAKGGDT